MLLHLRLQIYLFPLKHILHFESLSSIDILNLLTFEKKETAWEKADLSDDIISDEIYKEFMEQKRINYRHIKSSTDILVGHLAYVFDFNFPESLELVREKKYFEKIYNRFEFNNKDTMEKYKQIYIKVLEHIEHTLQNHKV